MKTSAASPEITLEDLRLGRVARLTTRQYAKLKNCRPCTEERKRSKGLGIPYVKDANTGAVYYMAEDVLAELEQPKHRSTAEYDTGTLVDRLGKARLAKNDPQRISDQVQANPTSIGGAQ